MMMMINKRYEGARMGVSRVLTLLHGSVHAAGVRLEQLLVRLSRLVEQLDEQGAGFLVLAAADGGELIKLLLHQTGIIQRVLHAIPQHTHTHLYITI